MDKKCNEADLMCLQLSRFTLSSLTTCLAFGVVSAQVPLGVIDGVAGGDNLAQVLPITDIDGDGTLDLALFSKAGLGPAVGVLLHSGVPPHPRLGQILGELFTFRISEESFAVIGDYDGDGHSDVAYREGSPTAAQYVQLYNAHTQQFLARCDDPGVNQWGFIVGGVGDIDGNGHDDLLIGGEDGTFHVYGGPNGNLIRTHVGVGAYGNSFALLGDLDGDGVRDYATGSGGVSRVWVFSGATGGELMQISRPPVDGFGHSLADAGDVNGDGVPDLIVGAPCSPAFTCPRNYVYVLSGVDGSEIWRITGERPDSDDRFGMNVTGAGDINGDGVSDFGASSRLSNTNSMYVDFYSGRTATLLWRFRESNPSSGFVGFPRILPDLDGDGLAEFAYAEPRAAFTATLAGRIWLFRGRHGDADRYCPSTPNSSGAVGRLIWQGPIAVLHPEAGVRVETGLAGSFAQVVYGVPHPGIPFGNGSLCLGGTTLYRWGPPLLLDAMGAAQRAVDWTAGPHVTGPGAWLPGAAFGLQAIYRDSVGARFDTTDALRIVFAP